MFVRSIYYPWVQVNFGQRIWRSFLSKFWAVVDLGNFKTCKYSKSYRIFEKHGNGLFWGNVRFSENLMCFVFMKHPFWDSPFCLITDITKTWIRCLRTEVAIEFQPFLVNVPILYTLKTPENRRHFLFLGNITWEYWVEIDLKTREN